MGATIDTGLGCIVFSSGRAMRFACNPGEKPSLSIDLETGEAGLSIMMQRPLNFHGDIDGSDAFFDADRIGTP